VYSDKRARREGADHDVGSSRGGKKGMGKKRLGTKRRDRATGVINVLLEVDNARKKGGEFSFRARQQREGGARKKRGSYHSCQKGPGTTTGGYQTGL